MTQHILSTINELLINLLSACKPAIIITAITLLHLTSTGVFSHIDCSPLDAGTNPCSITATSAQELRDAVTDATANAVICIADGSYTVANLWLRTSGLTIRSASGNREAVILDGDYASGQSIFNIRANNTTIADITIKRAWYHPVHISGGGNNALLHNLHIIDGREQFIKVNPNGSDQNDNGTLQCSLLELTDTGRQYIQSTPVVHPCYTGGIDTHGATGWLVSQNTFENIYCENYNPHETELAEHAIHFWVDTSDAIIEKNRIVNCARGIGFGLGSRGNSGGVIKNNMIYQGDIADGVFDVGISLESSPGSKIYNNTVFIADYSNAIEYRFGTTTDISIRNNLTNKNITNRSSGCNAIDCQISTNLTSAQSSWFTNPSTGDLHLSSPVVSVIDMGTDVSEVGEDFDGEYRETGGYDLGADEYTNDTSPTIISISSNSGDGFYYTGDTIQVVVDFSKRVTSISQLSLTFNSGGGCTFEPLINDITKTCAYTVGPEDESDRLNVTGISGIIEDDDSNRVTLDHEDLPENHNLKDNSNIKIGVTLSGSAFWNLFIPAIISR